ncbi:uncharacterized protein LOC129921290 [Episyrphus balteatus]|uniref:uncharacterized protein LOC129921290 n=1 Tax=Episyrphus balteatus TaxID=286459 RepID=UPI0024853E36|nr:uncharacterized protein LOC129921290 [Episyrphus balteatus]
MESTCSQFRFENYYNDVNSCEPTSAMVTTTPLETAQVVIHTFFTIIPIIFSVFASHIASLKITFANDLWKYLFDFCLIVVPIVLNVTILNPYVEVICVILMIILFVILRRMEINPLECKQRVLSLGHQPNSLTLIRSTINIITAVCILAIDFSTFPLSFRKSRFYGVGLMDTGIGLFVFSMGIVSKPPKTGKDFLKIPKVVGPVLFLGLARTIVIQTINYHQDDTEYGKHLNAFFTLGLTKLFGGLISSVVGSELQLLLLGMFILTTHECLLLYNVADYVMNRKEDRSTFFVANREGFCSLPGFVAIYLLAMYIGRFLFSETTLMVEEYSKKVKRFAIMAALAWIITFICIPTIRISRRISNFGYVSWTFSIALTILLLYIIMSDYVFYAWSTTGGEYKLPSLMEATNRNGLVFFLVANVLTGCVNMFLNPSDRSPVTSIVILSLYMLLSSSLVYILLRLRIKIA